MFRSPNARIASERVKEREAESRSLKNANQCFPVQTKCFGDICWEALAPTAKTNARLPPLSNAGR
jgi:hypothetical protein